MNDDNDNDDDAYHDAEDDDDDDSIKWILPLIALTSKTELRLYILKYMNQNNSAVVAK